MSEEAKDPSPQLFQTTMCYVTKNMLDDSFVDTQQWLKDEMDYATGAKERPPRIEPVLTPVEPTRVFAGAKEALRALVDSGYEAQEGCCQDRVCFYCREMLDCNPHNATCSYIAAKILLDKLDAKE